MRMSKAGMRGQTSVAMRMDRSVEKNVPVGEPIGTVFRFYRAPDA